MVVSNGLIQFRNNRCNVGSRRLLPLTSLIRFGYGRATICILAVKWLSNVVNPVSRKALAAVNMLIILSCAVVVVGPIVGLTFMTGYRGQLWCKLVMLVMAVAP